MAASVALIAAIGAVIVTLPLALLVTWLLVMPFVTAVETLMVPSAAARFSCTLAVVLVKALSASDRPETFNAFPAEVASELFVLVISPPR